MKNVIIIIFILLLFSSCKEVIKVNTKDGIFNYPSNNNIYDLCGEWKFYPEKFSDEISTTENIQKKNYKSTWNLE